MSATVVLKRVRWSERRGSCVHLLGPTHTACGLTPCAWQPADDEWQGALCLNCARAAKAYLDAGGEILVSPRAERFRLTAMLERRLQEPRQRPRRPGRLGYRRSRLSPLSAQSAWAMG